MTIKDITCCPFCGCEIFFHNERVKGFIKYRFYANGDEADNTEMWDSIESYTTNAERYTYCDNCNRKIAHGDNEELTKSALAKIKKVNKK